MEHKQPTSHQIQYNMEHTWKNVSKDHHAGKSSFHMLANCPVEQESKQVSSPRQLANSVHKYNKKL
jgi:hypothetical protein